MCITRDWRPSMFHCPIRFVVCVACVLLTTPFAFSETMTFTYDDNGRLASVTYGDGATVTYEYDASTNTVREVAASEDDTLFVAVSPAGGGVVTGAGISCPPDCSEAFADSPQVTLTAAAAPGLEFLQWGETLAGAPNPAVVTMDGDRMATAYFGAVGGHTDLDGLDDLTEMGPNGDPGYDGNFDGIPDYQQDTVASLPTAMGDAWATLVVQDGLTLANVTATADPSKDKGPPPGVTFPFGFFAFTVGGLDPGGCTTVDLHLPPARLPSYYKYGPTLDDTAPHWYEFVHYHPALPGAAMLPTDHGSLVRIWLCDAQTGDSVLVEDGLIVDPGGPVGEEISSVAQIDVNPTTIDLGDVPLGSSSQQMVTVANTGDGDLVLGAIAAADPLSWPFSVITDACSNVVLSAGASCQLTVAFAPTSAGDRSDTFDIPSNDPVSPSLTVAVAGRGIDNAVNEIPTLGTTGIVFLILLLAAVGMGLSRRLG